MEWIAPIKYAETTKNAKTIKQQQKNERLKQQKIAKQKARAKAKIEKAKAKTTKGN
jgi:hypothetical protein